MELLVFGHSGRAVLFFPTRMARFYDYENWRIIEAMQEKINLGEMQVICVDSIDNESFYNQGVHPLVRIKRHIQYEGYILTEVLPLIYSKVGGMGITVAGCSMGAYHAMNLAMKHPHLFNKVVGMSGRYDLTYSQLTFKDLFDGYHNDDIYFNMPLQYLSNMQNEHILHDLRKMEIIMVIGVDDVFKYCNEQLSYTLSNKGVPNQLYIWQDEAHKPRYWRRMVQIYL
ncbi:esterase family protein [Mucilaginibacter lacusdianchii]|uniref:esterase family protein n=1 Tax=Mucilaginibacter lacusdianchii TaxID=2684211 RepID=UPI00131EAA5B|nr:alpha/beta hydrolase-fold protein [Mucilaginibacter sp. JXJ CY 39]